jgi:subtilisin family serine protease
VWKQLMARTPGRAGFPSSRLGRVVALVAVMSGLVLSGPAQADQVGEALAGEVLVRLTHSDALAPLLVKHSLTLRARFGSRPIFRLGLVGAGSAHAKAEALGLEPAVLAAEPNYVHRSPEARKNVVWAIGTPGEFATQWAPEALRLPAAHALSRGHGVRVAVLDTGVDFSHPALAGRLLPGFDFVDFDGDPSERGPGLAFGHGTHVAGLVALAAPAARIMPLRVLDAAGEGNAWVLAEALLHAVDPDRNPTTPDGAQVINLSLGTPARSRILDAVAELAACALPPAGTLDLEFSDPGYNDDRARCSGEGGAVIVAAAGNDGSDEVREYPAAESVYGLLSVTASTANRRLAPFANFGSKVDVATPGDRITSAIPGGLYGTWSGTSMAAPLAAGVAALVRAAHPSLSPREVTRRLIETASSLCGTRLPQIDASQALGGAPSTPVECALAP